MSRTYDLVFEGGGAKGSAFVGAMRAFEEHQFTFNRLMGTSAGAITATMLAAGYDSKEMLPALNEKGDDGKPIFAQFLQTPPPLPQAVARDGAFARLLKSIDLPLVPDFLEQGLDEWIIDLIQRKPEGRQLLSLIEFGGAFAADSFLEWLGGKLDVGTFQGRPRAFSAMTLGQFHDATGVDLTLVAADVSASRLLFLNHRTAADCPVVYAVRMSMSVPFAWPEVIWQADWGPYTVGSRRVDLTDHAVVDGGLLSNFPIEMLISDDRHVTGVMGPRPWSGRPEDHVVGFLIDEALSGPSGRALSLTGVTEVVKGSNTFKRLMRLMNAATQAHDKMVIDAFEGCVVRLPARGYGTLEFDMEEEKRDTLVENAYDVAVDHFDRGGTRAVMAEEQATGTELANKHARQLVDW